MFFSYTTISVPPVNMYAIFLLQKIRIKRRKWKIIKKKQIHNRNTLTPTTPRSCVVERFRVCCVCCMLYVATREQWRGIEIIQTQFAFSLVQSVPFHSNIYLYILAGVCEMVGGVR